MGVQTIGTEQNLISNNLSPLPSNPPRSAGCVVDARHMGNATRRINHSTAADANVEAKIVNHLGIRKVSQRACNSTVYVVRCARLAQGAWYCVLHYLCARWARRTVSRSGERGGEHTWR
eukprot:SAG11_NODE_18136_length_499_cov_0.645000_1_plen_119_part_00